MKREVKEEHEDDYEAERQRTIAENKALLEQLGLEEGGGAQVGLPKASPKPKSEKKAVKKRKEPPIAEGPRRRSGRIAGLEADGVELAAKQEELVVEAEERRVKDRKLRQQIMDVKDMVEDGDAAELEEVLRSLEGGRDFPSPKDKEVYADKEGLPAEVKRLKSAFEGMVLRAQEKVTTERVYCMAVHPEKSKTVVFVGDKAGMLGIWDPLTEVKNEDGEDSDGIWRIQAHARNSISAMKLDPVAGKSLVSSAYDCSLRSLDFQSFKSTELFAFDDEDMLVSHFDLTPSGEEAWISDTLGGISHCDFREGGDRRRWVVQEPGRAAKLGGISVNPLMPHLICTASNDRNLRIWDVRHLSKIKPLSTETLEPPKSEDVAEKLQTYPTSNVERERIEKYRESAKGKGLLRASFEHGKSCSSAYWDPWGRRILTTSYDNKLRVWTLIPQNFVLDAPFPTTQLKPTASVNHNCQTGRWLTIFRAQWSTNTDHMPHFTVGNLKRTLDVIAATGDPIVKLWTDTVSAVPCVTASHPNIVNHVVGGNSSGRIQLWTPGE